jgi:uncharacterized membrane protein YuzA (DUF378 family)
MERTQQKDWTLNPIDWLFLILTLIGALNVGLVGLFNFDLLASLFGSMTVGVRIVYTIIGLSAVCSIIEIARHVHPSTFVSRSAPGVARY